MLNAVSGYTTVVGLCQSFTCIWLATVLPLVANVRRNNTNTSLFVVVLLQLVFYMEVS